ncbi:MAG: hypothetical protein VB858_13445 [Planctomycetaceae bacterium]
MLEVLPLPRPIDDARNLRDSDKTRQINVNSVNKPSRTAAVDPTHSDPSRRNQTNRESSDQRKAQPVELDQAWLGQVQRDLIAKLNLN